MATFEGKVIALTGGASGIGLATAQLLARRGATVSLADVNEAGLKDALLPLEGKGHISAVVDVSDSKQVDEWIARTVRELGPLDGVVNNAGVTREGSRRLAESLDEDWDFIMGINAKGVFNGSRAALRHMLENGKGSIVNISSVAGVLGLAPLPIYSASKHAVIGLTKATARAYGSKGIRANTVVPGGIATPLTGSVSLANSGPEWIKTFEQSLASQCMVRAAQPSEVGEVIAFLLSDAASFVTGATYTCDAGWTC